MIWILIKITALKIFPFLFSIFSYLTKLKQITQAKIFPKFYNQNLSNIICIKLNIDGAL